MYQDSITLALMPVFSCVVGSVCWFVNWPLALHLRHTKKVLPGYFASAFYITGLIVIGIMGVVSPLGVVVSAIIISSGFQRLSRNRVYTYSNLSLIHI